MRSRGLGFSDSEASGLEASRLGYRLRVEGLSGFRVLGCSGLRGFGILLAALLPEAQAQSARPPEPATWTPNPKLP